MKTWLRHLSLVLLAVGLVVWFSGCLSTTYWARLRYDEAKDEFTILNLYQNIDARGQADSQYLYQLWRNRDHLIRLPKIDFLSMFALLRLSPTTYAWIDLGQAPPKLDAQDTPIALDQIRVLPGTFFSREADDLCYYDQVVIPGKVIDQALVQLTTSTGSALTDAVGKELERRKAGGKRIAWGEAHRRIREQMASAVKPSTRPNPLTPNPPTSNPSTDPAADYENNPLELFDDQSLQLFRKSAIDGSMKLTRDKQVFRMTVPVSNSDAGQAVELWNAYSEAIKAMAAKLKDAAPENDGGNYTALAEILPAFALTARPGALEMKIDLAILAEHLPAIYAKSKLLSEPKGRAWGLVATTTPTTGPATEPIVDPETPPAAHPATAPAAVPEPPAQMRDTIAMLRAKGVPIDTTLTTDDVLKAFASGTLKSFPSTHPVDPGNGLVQEPPRDPAGAAVQPPGK